MYRKHIANFLLASSLAFGLAPLASAQPMQDGMGRGKGGHSMQLRALGLSEAQQDQVFKIFHESRPAVYEQIKQLRRARQELGKLVTAERFDSARARQLADAQGKAMAELALIRIQTMRRVREVLTPEQREKMDQMRERRGRGPRQ
jgi:periplasmic protein CpxP/Spy